MYYVPCRAVLFDLDGVLVDSMASIELAIEQWATSVGLDFNNIKNDARSLTDEQLIRMAVKDVDIDVEKEKIKQLEIASMHLVSAQPKAHDLILQVQNMQMPWAIVTSGQKEVVIARLEAANLPIPRILITDRKGKPDPEPYLLAAKLLGVPSRNCVAIEDTYNGAHAARLSGATTIGIATASTRKELAEVSNLIINTFDGLRIISDGITIEGK